MTTALQCNDEVFPGYVLVDRLGAGGYAEVWRAQAPGGIEKAIKFVYGYYDEELAAQEMKAMERIKDVRHPFLLSLERFEVVDGRLAILTELADMSLDQRARQCRAEGHIGIPREELLRYMSDAAEALDFLVQKHGLQHLDIKPENLLVSGDYVKVADFGLVKELTTRTQNSLIAGMTPTYASPEMFDDAPSALSDQYSLAIVYQEMLVGTLPFPGRTAAQLAKQHTQAEPQLMSLPANDRPIVARALAKCPEDRFPSCRMFVEALKASNSTAAPNVGVATPTPPVPQPAPSFSHPAKCGVDHTQVREDLSPPLDDTQRASACTTQRHTLERQLEHPVDCTQPVGRDSNRTADAAMDPPDVVVEGPIVEDIVDVPVPDIGESTTSRQPTLYIAIGGAGIHTLCQLRSLLGERNELDSFDQRTQMVALDTDRNTLKYACSQHQSQPLLHEDTLHMPLRLPKDYDEDCRESLTWLSRRWLYNIPRSLETRGFRPLGRVALVDHTARLRSLLESRLVRLVETEAPARDSDGRGPARVVIISGTGGGTGAGMVIDVANAIRALGKARNIDVELNGFLLYTGIRQANAAPLAAANTLALLTELTHASEVGNLGNDGANIHELFESTRRPFDAVYCVPAQGRASASASESDVNAVVKYLLAEATTTVGTALRACRKDATERESRAPDQFFLRTVGVESLNDEKRRFLHRLATDLGEAVKLHWLAVDDKALTQEYELTHQQERTYPAQADANIARVDEGVTAEFSSLAMRPRFGKHATSRFASGVLSQIDRRIAARDERGNSSFTPRHAQGVVVALASAFGLIATAASQPSGDARDQTPSFAEGDLRQWIVEGSNRVLSRLVGEIEHPQIDGTRIVELIDYLLYTECFKLLEAELRQCPTGRVVALLTKSGADIAQSLERADVDLLKCGYDRRTLVVRPAGRNVGTAIEKLKALRPLAAVVTTDSDDELLICEGAGVSPRSLARQLEQLYPGLGDAARRLFTRIDIDWRSLGRA